MPLSLVQAASVSYLRSQSALPKPSSSVLLLQKSIFPDSKLTTFRRILRSSKKSSPRASLLETPVLWAGRICVFYALVRAGLAGSKSNPIVSGQCLFLKLGFFIALILMFLDLCFKVWRVAVLMLKMMMVVWILVSPSGFRTLRANQVLVSTLADLFCLIIFMSKF